MDQVENVQEMFNFQLTRGDKILWFWILNFHDLVLDHLEASAPGQ